MAAHLDYTAQLAARLDAITPTTLSGPDLDRVHALFLDYCGVTLAGSSRDVAAALRRWGTETGRGRGAGLVGTDQRASPEIAALVNGAAAHSFELDDTHDRSMSHPGAVVFSAALAVSREAAASGPELAAAVTAGYEAMTRVGIAANAGEVIRRGFHPTALFGVVGAATAAAKVLGGDAEHIRTAWGHALSLAGGSMQFSDESAGTDVKRLHPGFAAHNGVLSAHLAGLRISAPSRGLDGKYGLLSLYGGGLSSGPGLAAEEELQIHSISVKPYACCRLFHSLIDALMDATEGRSVSPSDVSRIVVRAPNIVAEQHMLTSPQSSMAAQYSMPYIVGATLARGPADFEAYEPHRLGDTAIAAFANLVEIEVDAELEAQYPRHFGSGVDIILRDGTVLSSAVLDSRGTPANPMSRGAIVKKLESIVPGGVGFGLELDQVVGDVLHDKAPFQELEDLIMVARQPSVERRLDQPSG